MTKRPINQRKDSANKNDASFSKKENFSAPKYNTKGITTNKGSGKPRTVEIDSQDTELKFKVEHENIPIEIKVATRELPMTGDPAKNAEILRELVMRVRENPLKNFHLDGAYYTLDMQALNPLVGFSDLTWKEYVPYDVLMARMMTAFLKEESVIFSTHALGEKQEKEFFAMLSSHMSAKNLSATKYSAPFGRVLEAMLFSRLDASQMIDSSSGLWDSPDPSKSTIPEHIRVLSSMSIRDASGPKKLEFDINKYAAMEKSTEGLASREHVEQVAAFIIDNILDTWTQDSIKRRLYEPIIASELLYRNNRLKLATNSLANMANVDTKGAILDILSTFASVNESLHDASFSVASETLISSIEKNPFMGLIYMYKYFLSNESFYSYTVPGIAWLDWAEKNDILKFDVKLGVEKLDNFTSIVELNSTSSYPSQADFLVMVRSLVTRILGVTSLSGFYSKHVYDIERDVMKDFMAGDSLRYEGLNYLMSLGTANAQNEENAFSFCAMLALKSTLEKFSKGGGSTYSHMLRNQLNLAAQGSDSIKVLADLSDMLDALGIAVDFMSSVLSMGVAFVKLPNVEQENITSRAFDILMSIADSVKPKVFGVNQSAYKDAKLYIHPVELKQEKMKKYPIVTSQLKTAYSRLHTVDQTMDTVTSAEIMLFTEQGGNYSDLSSDQVLADLLMNTAPLPEMVGLVTISTVLGSPINEFLEYRDLMQLNFLKYHTDLVIPAKHAKYKDIILSNYTFMAVVDAQQLLQEMGISMSVKQIREVATRFPIFKRIIELLDKIDQTKPIPPDFSGSQARFSEVDQIEEYVTGLHFVVRPKDTYQGTMIIALTGLLKPLQTISEELIITEEMDINFQKIIFPKTVCMYRGVKNVTLRGVRRAIHHNLLSIARKLRTHNPWLNLLRAFSTEKILDVVVEKQVIKKDVISSEEEN